MRGGKWLLAVVLVCLAFAAACSDDKGSGANPDETTSSTEKRRFDSEADALIGLLDEARDLTFHAVYKATDTDNKQFDIEIWRKEGLVRQDVRAEAEGRQLNQSSFVLKNKSVSCSKTGEDPWKCQDAPGAPPETDAVFGAIRDQLANVDVARRTETIANREAQCFSWEAEGAKGELCALKSGLPVRASVGNTKLELVSDETVVPDSAFTPPAQST